MMAFLTVPITEPPLSDADLRALREQNDALLVPRQPDRELAPLIAALLSGHAGDVRARDADHWLLLRPPMPDGAQPLTEVLAARPDAFAALLLSALEAMHELHARGVILNQGARAGRQFLVPGKAGQPARVVVGWDAEWATVIDPQPSEAKGNPPAPEPGPFVLCASGDPCAHYPARDLLWFLSDLPRELDLGPTAGLLVVVAWRREPPQTSILALAPLGLVRTLGLPEGWEAHATPIGGPVVSLAEPEPGLVRDAWAAQMCGAAAAAVRRNRSTWAREDLAEALRGSGFASPLALLRDLGGERDVILVGADAAAPWTADVGSEPLRMDMTLTAKAEERLAEPAAEEAAAPGSEAPAASAAALGARALLDRLLRAGNLGRRAAGPEDAAEDEAGSNTQRRLRSVLDFFGAQNKLQEFLMSEGGEEDTADERMQEGGTLESEP